MAKRHGKIFDKIIDSKTLEKIRKRMAEDRDEREKEEKETKRLTALDEFIKRAAKVGLTYDRKQAEFWLNEFAPKHHEHRQWRA